MAEKTVQLLNSNKSDTKRATHGYEVEDKIKHYNRIKGWYNTRSEIIHGGYQSITREEVRNVQRTIESVVRELVSLSDEYHAIQKQGGDNNPHRGLNDMFLEKKFQTDCLDKDTSKNDELAEE